MQISTKWNVGRFDTTLTAEVTEEQVAALLPLALRYLGQRNTKIDRILGGFETVDGKEKRKADYKRNDVEYSDELAQALGESFQTLEFPDSTKEAPHVLNVSVDIAEYTGGGSAEPKYKREKDAIASYLAGNGGKLKNGDDRTVATFCASRNIEVPEGDWKEDTAFLDAVKAYLKQVAAAE